MCSVEPLDSVTVPLPAHEPSKPANGPPDWAPPVDTDTRRAPPTPAAVTARPKWLEANKFMVRFPSQSTLLPKEASRRIDDLVSSQQCRFKSGNARAVAADVRKGPSSGHRALPATGIFQHG